MQHKKQREKYINRLIDIIENSSEYQDFIKSNESYRNLIESNAALEIWEITFWDTYNNKSMNKLVKRLSKLNEEKYHVDLNYRPKRLRDLNYFTLQYSGSGVSSLATIRLLDDRFIREVTVAFTQVNNNQAVVEFKVSFNKIMDDTMFLEFIKENKNNLYKKRFIGYYDLDISKGTWIYGDIYRMFKELVVLTLQSKLMDIADLNYGVVYKLPYLKVVNYSKDVYDNDSFRDVFLSKTYEIRNGEQHLIADMTSREGLEMQLYFSGNTYSHLTFTNILSRYRMEIYYFLFDKIEEYELNQRMNKYFNQSKDKISSKDYKWLVNKIRAINDNKLHMNFDKSDLRLLKEWKAYYSGEETDLDFTGNLRIKKYETIYTECLEHVKVLYSVGKENLIIHLALMTLIATVLGIVITILN